MRSKGGRGMWSENPRPTFSQYIPWGWVRRGGLTFGIGNKGSVQKGPVPEILGLVLARPPFRTPPPFSVATTSSLALLVALDPKKLPAECSFCDAPSWMVMTAAVCLATSNSVMTTDDLP